MAQNEMGMPPSSETMDEGMHQPAGDGRDYGADNTAEVDIGFFGRDVKPGDTEQVKIISVDEDMGSATIQCVSTQPKSNSIGEAAAKFDNPDSQAAY